MEKRSDVDVEVRQNPCGNKCVRGGAVRQRAVKVMIVEGSFRTRGQPFTVTDSTKRR